MGAGFYAIVLEIIKRHGCVFIRQAKGSHEIWFSPISNRKFTVHCTVASRHSANKILRDAGINEKL
ncbi:type II toxin-antitoxin system HicA family toxin [Acinetobacter puyangensis]|uniref:type II toxin-antitoxin system HicA family toxin n=1 Tax=Acinetobacter puyangensis TaxID=1096779 RepID=UPI000BE2A7E7|nr:type II toxin-antitoxin system HicA family toxin [Acinetobacter puyangensis]